MGAWDQFNPNSEPGTDPIPASNKRRELSVAEVRPSLPKLGNIKIPPRGVVQDTPVMFRIPFRTISRRSEYCS